ncbi:MAG: hypothetical protein ABII12_06800 [Planctomycetota bacterium]
MEKVVQRFNSFQESDRADRRYYMSLDPQERLDILLDLLMIGHARYAEDAGVFKKVYRIVKLGES